MHRQNCIPGLLEQQSRQSGVPEGNMAEKAFQPSLMEPTQEREPPHLCLRQQRRMPSPVHRIPQLPLPRKVGKGFGLARKVVTAIREGRGRKIWDLPTLRQMEHGTEANPDTHQVHGICNHTVESIRVLDRPKRNIVHPCYCFERNNYSVFLGCSVTSGTGERGRDSISWF